MYIFFSRAKNIAKNGHLDQNIPLYLYLKLKKEDTKNIFSLRDFRRIYIYIIHLISLMHARTLQ